MGEVSFKSKINFVSGAEFNRFNCWRSHYVNTWMMTKQSVQIANDFYTESIRTCTAGGFINTKIRQAVGFHFIDNVRWFNVYTKDILNHIFELINPDKCLLLGGKNLEKFSFSMEQFEYLKDFIGKRVEQLTIFEEHLFPLSETNLRYSINDDTWNINTIYKDKQNVYAEEHTLMTPEELKRCFKNVVISPDDELGFHN